MAKILKHANKGEIVFLSKGNYSQLYTSILQTLGRNAPFAPVKITSTNVVWENNSKADYKSIVDAPEEIKGQLLMLFEQESKAWAHKLKQQNLEYALTVPDPSYLFYVVDHDNDDNVLNNRYHFLITGWACKFNRAISSGSDGLEKDIIEAKEKHQNVIVEMVDGINRPIANGNFTYNFNNSIIKDVTSDTNGRYNQGLCLVGSVYKFTYKPTGQTKELKVQKNIELYTLKFSPTINVDISIVDQFNQPVPSIKTEIRYGSFNCVKISDGHGKIRIDDLLYEDPSLRIVISPEGYSNHDFAVSCPNCNLTVVINVTPPIKSYLQVIVNGRKAEGVTINFSGAIEGAFSSDNDGKIYLPELLPGHSFSVSAIIDDFAKDESFSIIDGKEEYLFEINPPEQYCEPDEEIKPKPDDEEDPDPVSDEEEDSKPEPDNEEDSQIPIPDPFDCHIIVKAFEDDLPLANYSLKIESATINGIYITDCDGIIPIGKQAIGNELRVYTGELNEDLKIITVEESKNEYVIYVNKPIISVKDPDHEIPQECHIKVVSKITGKPVANYALVIDSNRMKGNYSTDENGILPLQNMTVGVNVTVIPGKHAPVQFEIEQYREEYVIQVDDSKTVLGDIMITQSEYDKKTPIPDAKLTLTNKKGQKFSQVTDSSGNIVAPRSFFSNNEKIRVHLDIPNRKVRDLSFKYLDKFDYYHLYLVHPFNWKKLLYLLIPIVIMLLSLIRCERDITVQTLNGNDIPIEDCHVSLEYTEHAFCKNGDIFFRKRQEHVGVTNNEGEYTFTKMPCSVFSYIFYTLHKGYVSAETPYGISRTESFVFHWNKNVKLVIDEKSLDNSLHSNPVGNSTIPILSPCDAGASGQKNVPAHTISEPISYNMGAERGTFEIEYKMGEVCPDQIVIYNHRSGDDWKKGKVVFDSQMKTTPNGAVRESVKFDNGSVVTVVVTTGPQNGSVWSYELSCPK
ncbi:MAG: hypothetical protein K2N35_13615 [Muribaculaceae bacterium]|nr:hypothetical protein [Muribaculaceae bacterium]